MEKEDPDQLIDYDFTDEQIEQIKRDFRVEKGADPSLPETKIDLNGNLLFFRGIVFSGVISVRQGGDFFYLNDYRFNIAIVKRRPITEKRIINQNEIENSAKTNKCYQLQLTLEKNVYDAMQKVAKESSLSLSDQKNRLIKLLKNINAKFDDIDVYKEDIVVCYENMPCISRSCDVMEKSIQSSHGIKRSINSDSITQKAKNIFKRQWQAFQERDFNNSPKLLFIFDSGLQISQCDPENGKIFFKQLNDIINSSSSFDKYLFLSLSFKMKECILPMFRVEYIFSNPDYYMHSIALLKGK